MAERDTKIRYDFEEDILCLSKGKKSLSSINIGDFVVDIDSRNLVCGIEILNASENLKITPKELQTIEEGSMLITYKPKEIYIHLILKLKEKEKDITIPLTVDLGHDEIKKEKTKFGIA